VKDPLILDSQTDQVIEAEEAPVIDLFPGQFPQAQMEYLPAEEGMKGRKAGGISRLSVEYPDVFLDKGPDFPTVFSEPP